MGAGAPPSLLVNECAKTKYWSLRAAVCSSSSMQKRGVAKLPDWHRLPTKALLTSVSIHPICHACFNLAHLPTPVPLDNCAAFVLVDTCNCQQEQQEQQSLERCASLTRCSSHDSLRSIVSAPPSVPASAAEGAPPAEKCISSQVCHCHVSAHVMYTSGVTASIDPLSWPGCCRMLHLACDLHQC